MKSFKALALASVLLLSSLPLYACGEEPSGGNPNGGNPNGDHPPAVEKGPLPASLLDGKVANLLGASGIGIVKKNDEEGGAVPLSSKISVKTDEKEKKEKQDKNELVKVEEDGEIVDVRFHEGKNGSNRDWNNKYGTHHHDKELCPKHNCDKPSDELLQEEQEEGVPTVTQLDARVNKLYNAGDYTFMCVSTAIEGEIEIIDAEIPSISRDAMIHAYWMHYFGDADFNNLTEETKVPHGEMPTLINLEKYLESDNVQNYTFSYAKVQSNGETGIIFVKRSSDEIGYHEANYWSDGFNQSYLIDNETGKTYSLAEFPYIYSVENGILKVFNDDGVEKAILRGEASFQFDYYLPKIVDEELTFEKIEIPSDAEGATYASRVLTDRYGNYVAQYVDGFGGDCVLEGSDQYGEIRQSNIIMAAGSVWLINDETYKVLCDYQKGDDGCIYRVVLNGDNNGAFNFNAQVRVEVLNEACEWIPVPDTTTVHFNNMQIRANSWSGNPIWLTMIDQGYAYYSVEMQWGDGRRYYYYSVPPLFQPGEKDFDFSMVKLPTQGGRDAQLQDLWLDYEWNIHDMKIYRIGDDSVVYTTGFDADRKLLFWNRKTDYKIAIAGRVESEIYLADLNREEYLLHTKESQSSCLMIEYCLDPDAEDPEWKIGYIPYQGVSVSENLSEWIMENPIRDLTVTFEEYYEFLGGQV